MRSRVVSDLYSIGQMFLGKKTTRLVVFSEKLRVSRDYWVATKRLPDGLSRISMADVAIKVVLSFGASLLCFVSCLHTVDALANEANAISRVWKIVVPFSIGLTGAAARYFHTSHYTTTSCKAEILYDAVSSSFRLFSALAPACSCLAWAYHPESSLRVFSEVEVMILVMGLPITLLGAWRYD